MDWCSWDCAVDRGEKLVSNEQLVCPSCVCGRGYGSIISITCNGAVVLIPAMCVYESCYVGFGIVASGMREMNTTTIRRTPSRKRETQC
jgi:hypothetical protein